MVLRDSEGRGHVLAHAFEAAIHGADLEPLGEWETQHFAGELDDDGLLRLWCEQARVMETAPTAAEETLAIQESYSKIGLGSFDNFFDADCIDPP